MTHQELDALQGLCDGARPGNWKAMNDNDGTEYYPFYVINDDDSEDGEWFAEIRVGDWDTAQFIAAARTALPALISEVRRLQAANDDLMSSGKAVCADNGKWAERHLTLQVKYDALENDLINANMNLGIMVERCEAAEADIRRTEGTCKHRDGCDYFSAVTGRRDCPGCDDWEWRGPQPTKEVTPDV